MTATQEAKEIIGLIDTLGYRLDSIDTNEYGVRNVVVISNYNNVHVQIYNNYGITKNYVAEILREVPSKQIPF